MNRHTHRTIYNHPRGCLMAVAETAKSSGKASGESRPNRTSKPKSPPCRKARIALSSGDKWLQANQGEGYSLPCLQETFNSALPRSQYEGYAPSQTGSGDEALRFALLHFATCTRPSLFVASQLLTLTGDGNLNAAGDLGLKLSGSHTLNNGSEILSNGNTTITVAGSMTNRGLIDGVNTTIVSGNLNNLGTGRMYGDNIAIQTGTLTNDAEGAGNAAVV